MNEFSKEVPNKMLCMSLLSQKVIFFLPNIFVSFIISSNEQDNKCTNNCSDPLQNPTVRKENTNAQAIKQRVIICLFEAKDL